MNHDVPWTLTSQSAELTILRSIDPGTLGFELAISLSEASSIVKGVIWDRHIISHVLSRCWREDGELF
jgi:hypothetical protein